MKHDRPAIHIRRRVSERAVTNPFDEGNQPPSRDDRRIITLFGNEFSSIRFTGPTRETGRERQENDRCDKTTPIFERVRKFRFDVVFQSTEPPNRTGRGDAEQRSDQPCSKIESAFMRFDTQMFQIQSLEFQIAHADRDFSLLFEFSGKSQFIGGQAVQLDRAWDVDVVGVAQMDPYAFHEGVLQIDSAADSRQSRRTVLGDVSDDVAEHAAFDFGGAQDQIAVDPGFGQIDFAVDDRAFQKKRAVNGRVIEQNVSFDGRGFEIPSPRYEGAAMLGKQPAVKNRLTEIQGASLRLRWRPTLTRIEIRRVFAVGKRAEFRIIQDEVAVKRKVQKVDTSLQSAVLQDQVAGDFRVTQNDFAVDGEPT
ncbi:MAG: hypothetical protein QM811_07665 [Pirellulales bacterium]